MAHSSLRYTPASGVGWNHLWSLGPTPFGPLSALATASSAQGGAALRNLAVVELDRHTGRIAAVLQVGGGVCVKGKGVCISRVPVQNLALVELDRQTGRIAAVQQEGRRDLKDGMQYAAATATR